MHGRGGYKIKIALYHGRQRKRQQKTDRTERLRRHKKKIH